MVTLSRPTRRARNLRASPVFDRISPAMILDIKLFAWPCSIILIRMSVLYCQSCEKVGFEWVCERNSESVV